MSITLDSDVGYRVAVYDKNGNGLLPGVLMADAETNPTIPEMAAFLKGLNPSGTWDRLKTVSASSSGLGILQVNPASVDGGDSSTGTALLPVRSADNSGRAMGVLPFLLDSSSGNGAISRARNTISSTYLASAARVATPTVSDITTYNLRGIVVFVNVTVSGGITHGITITIDEKDSVSGGYKTVLTSAAIEATGLYRFVVAPGVTVGASLELADVLSRTMRIVPTHADATSNTYSVSYDLVT